MNVERLFRPHVFEADAAGGGSSGPSAASGASAPAAGSPAPAGGGAGRDTALGTGAGSQPGSAEAANAWKAPDFLPDHLRDIDPVKTFEKLAPDWKRLRDQVANLPQPPKSAEEYKFEPGEKAKPYFSGDLAKDPALAAAREAALKAGIPATQFQSFVGGVFEQLAEQGVLPKPYDPEPERDALIGERAKFMTAEQKDAEIRPLLTPIVNYLEGLKRTGAIDADGYAALGGLLDKASGVRALAKLVDAASKGQPGLNPGGETGGTRSVTHNDLKARQRDPRNQPGTFAYDANYHAETQRLYQQLFG